MPAAESSSSHHKLVHFIRALFFHSRLNLIPKDVYYMQLHNLITPYRRRVVEWCLLPFPIYLRTNKKENAGSNQLRAVTDVKKSGFRHTRATNESGKRMNLLQDGISVRSLLHYLFMHLRGIKVYKGMSLMARWHCQPVDSVLCPPHHIPAQIHRLW